MQNNVFLKALSHIFLDYLSLYSYNSAYILTKSLYINLPIFFFHFIIRISSDWLKAVKKKVNRNIYPKKSLICPVEHHRFSDV